MDKEDVYMYTMEYYLAMKRNKIVPFAPLWMDIEIIMLSEISHMEKINTIWCHLYVESNKNDSGNISKQKENHRFQNQEFSSTGETIGGTDKLGGWL